MRKSVVILFVLISAVCLGQSNTYINGANIFLRNPGGTNHTYTQGVHTVTDSLLNTILLALNDSSFAVPNTKWIKQQNYGSGGGGGVPGGTNRSVQFNNAGVFLGTDSLSWAHGTLFIAKQDSAGFRFNYAWNSNPLASWTNNLSTTVLTTSGTTTNFNGGAQNFTNGISLNQYVGVEDWTITDTVIVGTKNSTSFGESYYLTATTGTGQSVLISYIMDDASGYIAYMPSKTYPTGSSLSNKNSLNFQWVAGDTTYRKIQKIGRTITASMTVKRTGMVSSLTINSVIPTVGQPEIYFHGGSWTHIGHYGIKYNELARPAVGGFGNSIEWGAYSTNYNSTWFQLATAGVSGGNCLMAAPTEASANGVFRIQDLAYVPPRVLLYAYGVNDRNGSVPTATYSANVVQVVEYCLAHSIRIILVNNVPQSGGSVVPYNDTLQAIATRYSLDAVVDIYTALKGGGTAMDTKYNSGDGVHPNQLGHTIMGALVRNALIPYVTFNSSPLNALLPLASNNRLNTVVADGDNNFFQLPFTLDSAYVNIQSTLDNTTVPQPGGFFTLYGWVQNALIVGGTTPNYLGGDFSVNKNGDSYTRASRFVSGTFYTDGAGTANIDGILTGTPQLNLLNGARIVGGYMSAAFPSGYSHALDYTALGNNDWPTKRLVDSLIAVGGGGTDSPDRINGTATGPVSADMNGEIFIMRSGDGTNTGVSRISAAEGNLWGWGAEDDSKGVFLAFQNAPSSGDLSVTLSGTSVFEYDNDYSANFTDRSLVDKAYVDAHSGGITGLTAARIPVAASATSLTDFEGLKWSSTNNELMISRVVAGHGLNIRGEIPRILMKDTTATNSLQLTFEDNGGNQAIINSNGVNIHFGLAGRNPVMKLYQSNNTVMIANDATAATSNSRLQVNGSFSTAYVAKTANYTATIDDYTINCTANTFQVTLPTAVGIDGRIYVITNSGAGTITVGTTSSQTFANVSGTPTTLTMAAVGSRIVQSNGANWLLISSL